VLDIARSWLTLVCQLFSVATFSLEDWIYPKGDSKKVSLDRGIIFELFMPRCPILVMKKIGYPVRSSLIDAIGNLYVVLTPGGPFVCCDIMKTLTLMSRFVLVLGLSFFAIQSTYAENSGAHPVKDLSNANQLIHWPKGFDPKDADAFVHNEIWN